MSHRSLLIPAFSALISLALPASAQAQQPVFHAADSRPVAAAAQSAAPAPATRSVSHWYGWQTLATDGASVVVALLGVAVSDGSERLGQGMGYTALLGYALGGPVVHAVHGNPGRAIGSLALRGGLPLAAGYAGSALEDCPDDADFCGLGGALLGGTLGVLGAILIDAAALGREERIEARPSTWPVLGFMADGERTWVTASGRF